MGVPIPEKAPQNCMTIPSLPNMTYFWHFFKYIEKKRNQSWLVIIIITHWYPCFWRYFSLHFLFRKDTFVKARMLHCCPAILFIWHPSNFSYFSSPLSNNTFHRYMSLCWLVCPIFSCWLLSFIRFFCDFSVKRDAKKILWDWALKHE